MYKSINSSSWNDFILSAAADPREMLVDVQLTDSSTFTDTGVFLRSSTFSFAPTPSPVLRVVALRVLSSASGNTLAIYRNPLTTQSVWGGDLPDEIEVDFNFAPDFTSITAASFLILGPLGIIGGGLITMLTPTSYQLKVPAPLAGGATYAVLLNGTSAPPITGGGQSLYGDPIGFPSGNNYTSGDFLASIAVTAGTQPAPTAAPALPPAPNWVSSPIRISGIPICAALETDNKLAVANSDQWNFLNLTANLLPALSPPLKNLLVMRSGDEWQMRIPIDLGEISVSDIQLSFMMNASTYGTWTARVPALSFTARSYTGQLSLLVTLRGYGAASMGIRTIDSGGNWAMTRMDWLLIP